MNKYLLVLLAFTFLGLFSCDAGERVLADDIEEIEDYLKDNNLIAERTENDLFYIIEEEGNGEFPTLSSNVTVDYEGYFTNGNIFDSSILRGDPLTFPLTNVISGWQQGIPLFSKGGKGKLLIPSHLAYGEAGTNGIGSNEVLIFDIHLISF